MAESWGRGTVFGVMPLSDARVYCYAAAPADPGAYAADELAELVRRFGTWHGPIPERLALARGPDVLRHDVAEQKRPGPAGRQARAAGSAARARRPVCLGASGRVSPGLITARSAQRVRVPGCIA